MSHERPVLTLKRKASDGSEKKSGPVVIGSKKVIVATPGRVKRKKVVPPPPPAPLKKETPTETFARRQGVNWMHYSEKALFALTYFIAKSKLKNRSGRKGGEIRLGVFVDTRSKYSYHCVDS